MNAHVAEYRSLPRTLGQQDPKLQERKTELVRALDDYANAAEVSGLLLELLRDLGEFEQTRAEALEVVGLYIDESSPLWRELFGEVLRIHADATEGEAIKTAAALYAAFAEQSLAD